MKKFEPGNVYSTPGVNAKLEDAGFMRLMSVYKRKDHPDDTIWIITEADRSVTTILLPDEY